MTDSQFQMPCQQCEVLHSCLEVLEQLINDYDNHPPPQPKELSSLSSVEKIAVYCENVNSRLKRVLAKESEVHERSPRNCPSPTISFRGNHSNQESYTLVSDSKKELKRTQEQCSKQQNTIKQQANQLQKLNLVRQSLEKTSQENELAQQKMSNRNAELEAELDLLKMERIRSSHEIAHLKALQDQFKAQIDRLFSELHTTRDLLKKSEAKVEDIKRETAVQPKVVTAKQGFAESKTQADRNLFESLISKYIHSNKENIKQSLLNQMQQPIVWQKALQANSIQLVSILEAHASIGQS